MQINWQILQPVDIGASFQQGLETGRAARDKRQTNNALAGLARDPNDGEALNALTQVNPQMGMQFRQQQQSELARHNDEWVKVVGNAAKMADTPEKWDGIVDHFVANGYPDAARLKGQFSPAARTALMAQAGISDDDGKGRDLVQADGVFFDKNTGQPVFESPYDKINFGPNGQVSRTPRFGIGRGGSVPALSGTPPQAGVTVQGNGLPEGWVVDEEEGGQTPPASGGFLAGGWPYDQSQQ